MQRLIMWLLIWSKNQQPIALGILYTNHNDKNAPK